MLEYTGIWLVDHAVYFDVLKRGQCFFPSVFSFNLWSQLIFQNETLLKSSWILIMSFCLWKIVKYLLEDKEDKCTSYLSCAVLLQIIWV